MLSTIKQFWPPAPCATTGFKYGTYRLSRDTPTMETLRTLETLDWWTGLRIATFGAEPAMFQVRIVDSAGTQFGPDWVQESNMWVPFYWAIPSALALKEGFRVEVKLVEVDARIEPEICLRLSFHTLADQSPHYPYLFIDEDLKPRYTWIDGILMKTDQAPDNCCVINPMSVLIDPK